MVGVARTSSGVLIAPVWPRSTPELRTGLRLALNRLCCQGPEPSSATAGAVPATTSPATSARESRVALGFVMTLRVVDRGNRTTEDRRTGRARRGLPFPWSSPRARPPRSARRVAPLTGQSHTLFLWSRSGCQPLLRRLNNRRPLSREGSRGTARTPHRPQEDDGARGFPAHDKAAAGSVLRGDRRRDDRAVPRGRSDHRARDHPRRRARPVHRPVGVPVPSRAAGRGDPRAWYLRGGPRPRAAFRRAGGDRGKGSAGVGGRRAQRGLRPQLPAGGVRPGLVADADRHDVLYAAGELAVSPPAAAAQ